jgi:hypothetical protein
MRSPAVILTLIMIAVSFPSLSEPRLVGVTAQGQPPPSADPDSSRFIGVEPESRPRIGVVRTADFYLRDGQFITGKLLDDDKSKITIERRQGSTVDVLTYTKKEVDTRTLRISSTPEYKFYEELGDYFAGRTWDFRDDPDDFIGAARAYETAKAAAVASERKQEDIDQIQTKIDKLNSDKQTWTKQMQDRSELKKLEFQATSDERIKDLENKFDKNTQLLDEALQRFDAFAKQTNKSLDGVQKGLSGFSSDFSRRMQDLEKQIENNRRMIEDIDRYRYYGRRYY